MFYLTLNRAGISVITLSRKTILLKQQQKPLILIWQVKCCYFSSPLWHIQLLLLPQFLYVYLLMLHTRAFKCVLLTFVSNTQHISAAAAASPATAAVVSAVVVVVVSRVSAPAAPDVGAQSSQWRDSRLTVNTSESSQVLASCNLSYLTQCNWGFGGK